MRDKPKKIKLEGILADCRTQSGSTTFKIEGHSRTFSFFHRELSLAPPINNGEYIRVVAIPSKEFFYVDQNKAPLMVLKADIYEACDEQMGRLLHRYSWD